MVTSRMRQTGISGAVCTKTLYSYIDQGLIKGVSNESLWEKRKRRKHNRRVLRRHRKLPARRQSIEKRPDQVEQREQFGHWEIDLLAGPSRRSKATHSRIPTATRA